MLRFGGRAPAADEVARAFLYGTVGASPGDPTTLVRMPRVSVMPVPHEMWKAILEMAEPAG